MTDEERQEIEARVAAWVASPKGKAAIEKLVAELAWRAQNPEFITGRMPGGGWITRRNPNWRAARPTDEEVA